MGFLKVHDDQVGQRALADDAQFAFGIAHRPRAVHRRQPQRLPGRKGHGIARRGFLQEGRRAHLLEHVKIVVRAGSVRADRHQRTRGAHPLDGRHAARYFHVALRVVRHGDAPRGECLDVAVGHVDAVRADGLRPQQSQPVEVFDRGFPVLFAHDAHLVLRLRDMGHQMQAVFVRQPLAAQEVLGRHGIGRMGRQGDLHPVASGGQPHGLLHLGHHLVDIRIEVVAAQHGADAQPFDRLHAAVFEIVHVDERRHAAQQHLDHAERHAQRHIVGRLTRLEGPDIVVEPLHQGDVVGKAALQGHGRMAVGVHQPRHHEFAPAVELPKPGVRRAEPRGGRFRLRDQCDAVAVDAHPARKGAGGVPGGRHRQHRRV